MANNSTNINKMNNLLKPLNIKKTTYDVGNPGLAWDMHKIVVGLNWLKPIPIWLFDLYLPK
jgi:hypothetical protein